MNGNANRNLSENEE
jgi:hypothetical protein